MDLVRSILMAIEADGTPELAALPEFPDKAASESAYHVRLLREAGYLSAIDCSSMDGEDYIEIGLTWSGHEFLDSVRDPEVWKQTKAGATKLGSWTVGLLGQLAAGYVRQRAAQLGLPLA